MTPLTAIALTGVAPNLRAGDEMSADQEKRSAPSLLTGDLD